jgi:predicted ester cyclase
MSGRSRRGKIEFMGHLDERPELELFYRRYNQLCNDHQFDQLGNFVAENVQVNGQTQGLSDYIAGLKRVIDAFPDYRWNIRHLLVEDELISAHFLDTGTHRAAFLGIPATGRSVSIQEFAIYRLHGGRFAEVWVTADNYELLQQLR